MSFDQASCDSSSPRMRDDVLALAGKAATWGRDGEPSTGRASGEQTVTSAHGLGARVEANLLMHTAGMHTAVPAGGTSWRHPSSQQSTTSP